MLRISCAMIARDAQGTIETALRSVRPFVDELVVLDTGSTDDTRDIAERYADVTGLKLWKDHFAEMREESFQLCTGDWILHLDADDELIGGEHLRYLAETAAPDLGAYMLKYVTDIGPEGEERFFFWRERFVRRGCYRWQGRVHEVLIPTKPLQFARTTDTHVIHRGHGDGRGSLERNIRLMRLALAETPQDARMLFYLGRDLLMVGELDEALFTLQRYLPRSTWVDEAFTAQLLIGHIHRVKGDYDAAYRNDLGLLNLQPMWPQAYFALSEDCYYLRRWEQCVHFCSIGESLPIPETNLFTASHTLLTSWMIYKVVALYQMGRVQEAAELTDMALELMPDNEQHRQNKAFFEGLKPAQPAPVLAAKGR